MSNLLPFALYSFVMSITPGPNNVLVVGLAAIHGVRATLPQVVGVSIGLGVMVLLMVGGLATPLAVSPVLHDGLRWLGGAWIIYLAWKIGRSGGPDDGDRTPRPRIGPFGAMLLQWLNPKAWVMGVVAATTYAQPGDHPYQQALGMALVFAVVCLPCVTAWAVLGAAARKALHSQARIRVFNCAMAFLLIVSVVPALLK